MKKNSFRISLSVKLCALIVIICLAATIITSVINYNKYLSAVYDVHYQYSNEICTLVEGCLTEDQWAEYSELLNQYRADEIDYDAIMDMEESEGYAAAYDSIQQIVDSHDLTSLSIFTVDRDAINGFNKENFDLDSSDVFSFLMDFYPSDSEEATYAAGDQDYWWASYEDFSDYRGIFNEIYESGEDYCINEDLEDGSMYLSNYYPIFSGEDIVAFICLSSNAIEIEDFMNSFFIETLLIGLAITLALIALALIYIYFRTIRPLKLIKKESMAFLNRDSEGDDIIISDTLSKIRTHDEIQDLAESFLKMEKDIKDYVSQVTQVTAEKERISTELNVATKIQEDMLPRLFPAFPERREFDVYASMDPAKEVGGDFYDFFLLDENNLCLLIADVAGKGVPAALFMVIAKTLIKNRALMGGTPSEILEYVNTQLCENNETNMFVTVWMAIIDLKTGKGLAANAGHEHPVRQNKGNSYELIQYRHSPAVASFDELSFREHSFELKSGDRIFVYTDGLPEATNEAFELYGTDRLMNVLNNNQNTPIKDLLPIITKDVEEFVGNAPQFDDLTMLVFEYNGPEA